MIWTYSKHWEVNLCLPYKINIVTLRVLNAISQSKPKSFCKYEPNYREYSFVFDTIFRIESDSIGFQKNLGIIIHQIMCGSLRTHWRAWASKQTEMWTVFIPEALENCCADHMIYSVVFLWKTNVNNVEWGKSLRIHHKETKLITIRYWMIQTQAQATIHRQCIEFNENLIQFCIIRMLED